MTPTSRSLQVLREAGYLAFKVEHWNAYARIRQDFAGFADILAYGVGQGVLAIQTTTGANLAARRTKCLTDPKVSPRVNLWLISGNRLILHGWAKQGARGKRKIWTLRAEEIQPSQQETS